MIMPKLSLEEKISRLAAEFAAQLVDLVRDSSLADLASLQAEKKKPGPKPGRKKPGPKPGTKRKKKPGPKPGTKRKKPGPKPGTKRKKPGPKPGSKRKVVKKAEAKKD
jgi:hypothetical protein